MTRVGLVLNVVLTGALAVLVAAMAPHAVRLFTGDAHVVDLGAHLLRISVWGCLLLGIGSVFSGVMRAAGTVRVPMLISLGCLALLQFPVGCLMAPAFGIRHRWFTSLVTYACGPALQAAYYFGIWRKKPIRRLA